MLRVGGTLFVCVWALEQEGKRKYDQQDVLVPWQLQERYSARAPAEGKAKGKRKSKQSAAAGAEHAGGEQAEVTAAADVAGGDSPARRGLLFRH